MSDDVIQNIADNMEDDDDSFGDIMSPSQLVEKAYEIDRSESPSRLVSDMYLYIKMAGLEDEVQLVSSYGGDYSVLDIAIAKAFGDAAEKELGFKHIDIIKKAHSEWAAKHGADLGNLSTEEQKAAYANALGKLNVWRNAVRDKAHELLNNSSYREYSGALDQYFDALIVGQ